MAKSIDQESYYIVTLSSQLRSQDLRLRLRAYHTMEGSLLVGKNVESHRIRHNRIETHFIKLGVLCLRQVALLSLEYTTIV